MDEKIEHATSTARAHEPDDVAIGLVVADTYRLLERLGTGGMADVYEAEHLRLGSRVAVKLARTNTRADRRGIERFRHEARRVAALSSEHVVKVFDCGELPNGTPYLVMERLWGEDLRSLLGREGTLPIRRAVELAIGACRGLSVVHAAGLVHRDLKPANLFVSRGYGGSDSCKILDFGVAKALVSDATAGGALLGTVRYMAPEQLEDAASARAAADVYAVGAILYECLTGVPAHDGETIQKLMFDIVHRDVVRPSTRRAMPKELEEIVLTALSREPGKRFAGAEQFAAALGPFGAVASTTRAVEGIGDETVEEEDGPQVTRPARPKPSRNVSLALSGLGVTIATIGALVWRAPGNSEPNDTSRLAQPTKSAAMVATEPPRPVAAVTTPPPAQASSEPTNAPPTSSIVPMARRAKSKATTAVSAPATSRFDSRNPYSD